MELLLPRKEIAPQPLDIKAMGDFIARLQQPTGEIPWSTGGKTDPWDHVESAMGLDVAGYCREAERAYLWLKKVQLPDGGWWAAFKDGKPQDLTRESNHAAYLAVGLYHHFLITGDVGFVRHMWRTMEAGINYAIGMQTKTGEIHWARDAQGHIDRMALLTASSSVYMSIKCALRIANHLKIRRPGWEEACLMLGKAIRHRPDRFNMMKSRYSMDWYYPVLCGAVAGEEARARIERSWDKFVIPKWGVRCVQDQPWVTTAETSELVLALSAIGERERAAIVLGWIADMKYEDGSFWMGVTYPEGIIWPEERTSWTVAAVLLAHDALNDLTPAGRLFSHHFWE